MRAITVCAVGMFVIAVFAATLFDIGWSVTEQSSCELQSDLTNQSVFAKIISAFILNSLRVLVGMAMLALLTAGVTESEHPVNIFKFFCKFYGIFDNLSPIPNSS